MRTERRSKAVALVATGIAVGVALAGTPAGAHVGGTVNHLWNHLKAKTDARYYTKAQSDGRFLPGGDLPSGRTLRGNWSVTGVGLGTSEPAMSSISFGWRFGTPPTPHVVLAGDNSVPECPNGLGAAQNPQAAPGHLCIYQAGATQNAGALSVYSFPNASIGVANRLGATIRLLPLVADARLYAGGTWAATAG